MKENEILAAGEPASTPLQSQKNPPDRILVVEDNIAIRHLHAEVLLRAGYTVDTAEDGAAAWEALSADCYDLMITDNSMPNLSGVELLKKLRAARMTVPVIMATGMFPEEEFKNRPWLLPAAMLIKPHTGEELLRTVKKVLREAYGTTEAAWRCPTKSPPCILVVDEDLDLRRLYAEALVSPGYKVDFAENGDAAWEALQASNYNLLITENALPGLTGVELVRKARAAHMALPIVMAAARMPTHELAQNPALQLAATLVKPFAVNALLDTVQNILRAADSPRENTGSLSNWLSQPSKAIGLRL